ncbi:uncharacterized protein LOC143133585 [Alosa pseudoharengus]|uniref:uncharacterized protein LOC143133585 n=1 Tax=Alosa pseudoharengus TaxID=34774 RepID=UPI003F8A09A4
MAKTSSVPMKVAQNSSEEEDFKDFGEKKVFARLIEDLKDLEETGFPSVDEGNGTASVPDEPTQSLSLLDTSLTEEHRHTPPRTATTSTLIQNQNAWVQNFAIPWDKMPARLSRSISRGKRADPADRRSMIRTVVGAMQEHCANPNRTACVEMAKMIVSKHPLTFADTSVDGEQLGTGYHSLVNQLKIRIEHVNRNNTVDRIRKPRTRDGEDPGTSTKTVRCKADSYGCINWQPKLLPGGESAESLEQRRHNLTTIFQSVGPRAVEMPEVDISMSLTYIYQRHMINACPPPTMSEMKDQWPFLFTKRGVCEHFKTLTGIDITTRLGEALMTKGKRIINYFQEQHDNSIQSLLRGMETSNNNQTAIGAVLLMMKHFNEKEESIFVLADTFATATSIENDMDLPITPRLIMLGNTLLTSTKWMVSMEGKVAFVLDEHLSFTDALSVFFSSFYVFNIEYQEPACATLELIQRFFVRINPEDGTKCTTKTGVSRKTGQLVKRKALPINNRVASFVSRLTQFEWQHSN